MERAPTAVAIVGHKQKLTNPCMPRRRFQPSSLRFMIRRAHRTVRTIAQKMKESAKIKLTHRQVYQQLKLKVRADKAAFLPGFFKAFPGGYGEGDKFLGVVVPDQRAIALNFRDLPLAELSKLLGSPWHECRLTGLFVLISQFERASKATTNATTVPNAKTAPNAKTGSPSRAEELVAFYLDHLDAVNNWDLVDASAYKILGAWVLENPRERRILQRLANSKQLWRERTSVIATLALIRAKQYDEIMGLAKKFLSHEHDLMHKAIGWMLREMGKRNPDLLRAFLNEYVTKMPRTMLRYSIEKMSREERSKWLAS